MQIIEGNISDYSRLPYTFTNSHNNRYVTEIVPMPFKRCYYMPLKFKAS